MPTRIFSTTGSCRGSAENAAKYAYLGFEASYFSDINDLMAEGEGFEPSVQFCAAKPRHVRKLQIMVTLRENLGRKTEV